MDPYFGNRAQYQELAQQPFLTKRDLEAAAASQTDSTSASDEEQKTAMLNNYR